ncbi:hypothetical protein U9M73_13155 [Paenibacillus phoenicis]|uniref:SMODS and SLOG-associating 2TM effector domain-containing protein n=1 Tax=Paenibacillus phoenicis TaxID=554117 RepID=A0ABU5PLX4_9BACL|nr:hypothetical protein [Paenibacillus phoenicis]MEA3570933.1 hypothetical protein [Paenibacillus phoenicis]
MSDKVNIPIELIKVVIPGLIAFWAAMKTTLQSRHLDTTKEIFNRFYLPAFKILEPHLYGSCTKQVTLEISEKLELLAEENYEFAKGRDINLIRKYRHTALNCEHVFYDNTSQIDQIFQELCMCIDKEFERCRRKLGLPTRTFIDKLNSGKYSKSVQYRLGEVYRLIEGMYPLILIAALSILMYSLIDLIIKIFTI